MMLTKSFHRSFIPERKYISALLDYIALGQKGTIQDISQSTGIPMGKSTGKAPAIIEYSIGMGLINLESENSGIKILSFTDFGIAVYQQDKLLGEELTQMLCHFHLCGNKRGAEVWNALFAISALGRSFTKDQLEDYLQSRFGREKNRTGPLLSTYTDDAAFARARILKVDGDRVVREKAPLTKVFAKPYASYINFLLSDYFIDQQQVTLSDLNDKSKWFEICSWNESDVEKCMDLVEQTGLVLIDKQTRPWIVENNSNNHNLWRNVWEDIA